MGRAAERHREHRASANQAGYMFFHETVLLTSLLASVIPNRSMTAKLEVSQSE
jgi:hypothetical protein